MTRLSHADPAVALNAVAYDMRRVKFAVTHVTLHPAGYRVQVECLQWEREAIISHAEKAGYELRGYGWSQEYGWFLVISQP